MDGKTKDPERLARRVLEGIARAKRKALGAYIRVFDSAQGLGTPLFGYPGRLEACGMAEVERALEQFPK